MSASRLQARLLRQTAATASRAENASAFPSCCDIRCASFSSSRLNAFGPRWEAPQAFRCPQQADRQIGEVLRLDGEAVPSFWTEANQRRPQIVIDLPQGLERVRRHYPCSIHASTSSSSAILPVCGTRSGSESAGHGTNYWGRACERWTWFSA